MKTETSIFKFQESDNSHTYLSKGGKIKKETVQHRLTSYPDIPDWPEESNQKQVYGPDTSIEREFRAGCYVSFPSGRSETPYWSGLNANADDLSFDDRFANLLRKPISIRSSIQSLKPWLVGVIMDQRVDATAIIQQPSSVQKRLADATQQHTALSNFNSLLRIVLQNPNARIIRSGRQAGLRKLQIYEDQTEMLPSLDAFSSGQAMLIGIFWDDYAICRYRRNRYPNARNARNCSCR